MVEMLESERLPIRLGALELLEELTGDGFGFDAWAALGTAGNLAAIEKWRGWAAGDETKLKSVYAILTEQQIQGYIAISLPTTATGRTARRG